MRSRRHLIPVGHAALMALVAAVLVTPTAPAVDRPGRVPFRHNLPRVEEMLQWLHREQHSTGGWTYRLMLRMVLEGPDVHHQCRPDDPGGPDAVPRDDPAKRRGAGQTGGTLSRTTMIGGC